MKKSIFILSVYLTYINGLFSQYNCTDGRFVQENYFDSVILTENILFGENINVALTGNQSLYLNFFEPYGDTLSKRPLIVLAFSGSFVGGDKSEVTSLCEFYAKLGYTCAGIDYRVGFFFPVNEVNTTNAVLRAMHDMKAAVRFFKKDAATVNEYKIDTNTIVVGGISAGAITALQTAFLDQESEMPSIVSPSSIGGVEGNSGNAGYTSNVHAVLNFSGAIGDTNWIDLSNNIPVYSVHDTGDAIVPFNTREVLFGGVFPTGLVASGSKDVHARIKNTLAESKLTTYNTNGHVSYFMDSLNTLLIINESKLFLENNVVCKYAVSVNDKYKVKEEFVVFPNPIKNNNFTIVSLYNNQYYKSNENVSLSVIDHLGKVVYTQINYILGDNITLDDIAPGNYYLNIHNGNSNFTYPIIKL